MYIIKHHCTFSVIANKSQMKNCEFISSLKPYDNPQMNKYIRTYNSEWQHLIYVFSCFLFFFKSHT